MQTQFKKVNDVKYSNIISEQSTNVFDYNGSQITFFKGKDVLINLTDVAKAFPDKNLTQIINSQEIQDYLQSLSKLQNYSLADLVQVRRGGNNPGTWANQKVALRVCQKFSSDLSVWVDTKIEELLTTGVATINNEDETIINAISILQKRLDSKSQQVQMLEGENQVYREEITKLEPKARYTDEVLQSTSTFTATQMSDHFRISTIKFNNILKEKGIQYSQSGQWHLTAKYKNLSLTEVRVGKYVKGDEIGTNNYMVWTEKGRKFLVELFKSAE